MTICFDLRALQIGHENRGIGMYIKSVLEHLSPGVNTYIFYAFDKNNPIKALGIKLDYTYTLVQTPTIKTALQSPSDIFGFLKLINHSFSELKSLRPDVFVQFDFTLGMPKWSSTKKIVIGYDLIPLIKKNEYLPSLRFAWNHSAGKKAKLRAILRSIYYRFKYRLHYKVFKNADKVVAISNAAAETFHEILGIAQERLIAIPLAPVNSDAKPDNSIIKKIQKPYMLYVGGTDSRKRIQDLVYAFNIARGRGLDLRLALAGNEFSKLNHVPNIAGRNAIIDSPYNDDIVLLGFVSDAEKVALYQAAYAFVFCTTFEGFGLPIIEAMSLGCPVISYNNSSTPEAAGHAALLVKTGDYTAVARQLLMLKDQLLREKLVAAGFAQAKKFDWQRYAAQFTHVLNEGQ